MTQAPTSKARPAALLGLLFGLIFVAFVLHVALGSTDISPIRVAQELFRGPSNGPSDGGVNVIVWQLRLPRCLMAVLVGGILGVVGSAFQAQLRNPLAEPYVLGVSSGAAVGGAIALVAGWSGGFVFAKPLCGFIGGIAALGVVFAMARRNGFIARESLILAGVVVGSFFSAVLTMVLLSGGQDTNRILQWLLGDLSNTFWPDVSLMAPTLLIGTAMLFSQSRRLNALAFGESTARQLGVDAGRLGALVLVTGTAMVAIAVGTIGVVGFVGLVSPHIARRVLGVDWRWSLPGSMVCGALVLTCADIVSQRGLTMFTHLSGMEPPVGLVTAFVGAPALLWLMKKKG